MSTGDARAAASQFAAKYVGSLDKGFVRGLYLAQGELARASILNRRQLDIALDNLINGEGSNNAAGTDLILSANRLRSGGDG